MFAVRTRPLGNNHQATVVTDREYHQEAPLATLQRSLSHPSAGNAAADELASDFHAFKMEDAGAPLAVACHRAFEVLGSPSKRSARARKFAEIDRHYEKSSPVTSRLSLDEPRLRRKPSKPIDTAPPQR